MTEPTAAAPNATEPASPDVEPAPSDVETGPAPTILVLTEGALKPVDVDKIVTLHQEEAPSYRVLVPADTDRNLLSSFLDHLSLFEMRQALAALKPVDRDE